MRISGKKKNKGMAPSKKNKSVVFLKDELHYLLVCLKYESNRDQLFNIIIYDKKKFLTSLLLNMGQTFIYSLNSEENDILNSVGKYLI